VSEVVEYGCEGCGVTVFSFGRPAVPKSHMCAVCEWMCEFVPDPVEMMEMRCRQGLIEGHRQ
jgi:hypothetical protein